MAPTTIPTIAGNASVFFPARLFSAFANLSNYPPSFVGEPPAPPPPRKTPVIGRTIVEKVIQRAVRIENIVIPCSRNKVRIHSAKDVFWSRTFSWVCLTLATCVWRSFLFCDNISNLACFSVFKLSNLSCITVFVYQNKRGHFLLPPTFWYLFLCVY